MPRRRWLSRRPPTPRELVGEVSPPELSCGLPPGPDFADLAVLAEELGYRRVWIFDSAPLWEDPFVHLALAAVRTSRIGLATAVLIPTQRSLLTTASSIATIARLSGGRFRAAFGTGYTSRMAAGQRPLSLDGLFDYVASLRALLAGETTSVDGAQARMLHWPSMAAARPIDVPLWLSVLGPRGNARAPEVADGTLGGPVHPSLPTAVMVSGTVLEPGEDAGSARAAEAIGPWRVVGWHTAYAVGGATRVDALPGGAHWREELEGLAGPDERHLLTFEGHVTHLSERDRPLLEHIDTSTMVGDAEQIAGSIAALGEQGFCEVMYTPSGPDVARELTAVAAAVGRR
jgi:5,10-methylenetetrahydromethanopterin reductase